MNDPSLQLALREWRAHMYRSALLSILTAIAAVLAVMGPFETQEAMRTLPRFVYWLVIVVLAYAWGTFVNIVLRLWRNADLTLVWDVVAGLVTGLGIVGLVTVVNLCAFGFLPRLATLPQFAGPMLIIALIVSITMRFVLQQTPPPEHQPQGRALPPLLDRLPFEKRGALVALSVEDHYVLIQTVNGQELVLLRLSDAIREVGDTPGAQVHRSHWAAFDAVKSVQRTGDRAILTMTTGQDIPVSRANLPKLREAGLLPERA